MLKSQRTREEPFRESDHAFEDTAGDPMVSAETRKVVVDDAIVDISVYRVRLEANSNTRMLEHEPLSSKPLARIRAHCPNPATIDA